MSPRYDLTPTVDNHGPFRVTRTDRRWMPDALLRSAIFAPWITGSLAALSFLIAVWLPSVPWGSTGVLLTVATFVLGCVSALAELPRELNRRLAYDADSPQDRKDAR
jgi:hypothetical protein